MLLHVQVWVVSSPFASASVDTFTVVRDARGGHPQSSPKEDCAEAFIVRPATATAAIHLKGLKPFIVNKVNGVNCIRSIRFLSAQIFSDKHAKTINGSTYLA
jgi:hypothetical protein